MELRAVGRLVMKRLLLPSAARNVCTRNLIGCLILIIVGGIAKKGKKKPIDPAFFCFSFADKGIRRLELNPKDISPNPTPSFGNIKRVACQKRYNL